MKKIVLFLFCVMSIVFSTHAYAQNNNASIVPDSRIAKYFDPNDYADAIANNKRIIACYNFILDSSYVIIPGNSVAINYQAVNTLQFDFLNLNNYRDKTIRKTITHTKAYPTDKIELFSIEELEAAFQVWCLARNYSF